MKIPKITTITALVCLGLLTTTALPVIAQVSPGSGKPAGERVKGYDDWHFTTSLDGWLTSFQGDITARGKTSPVNVDLADVLTLLFHGKIDFTIDGRFDVSKGPWGGYVELEYARLSGSGDIQRNIRIPILDPPEFTLTGDAHVLTVYSTGEAALSYDVYASPCLVANMPELIAEVLAGARYQYIRSKVSLEVTAPLPGLDFYADQSKTWVDPFVGGRVVWRPGTNWVTSLQTDFGGFTVSSDVTFNARAEAAYRINKWFFVNAGYRALYTDYETGSDDGKFAYNMWVHGPFFGVGAEF